MFKINLPLNQLSSLLTEYRCPEGLREYTLASLKLKPANDKRINVRNSRAVGWKFTEPGNIFATACLVDYESERPGLFKGTRNLTEIVLVYVRPEWQNQNLGRTITRNTYESLIQSNAEWIRILCCTSQMDKVVRKTILTTNQGYELYEDSVRRDYWIKNPDFKQVKMQRPSSQPSNIIQFPFAQV